MVIPFVKMHGLGNDYVLMDQRSTPVDEAALPHLARAVSARHTGVGADGLILALPGNDASSLRMRVFNADGSEASMCGNGLRLLAWCAVNRLGFTDSPRIELGASAHHTQVIGIDDRSATVEVTMQTPVFMDPVAFDPAACECVDETAVVVGTPVRPVRATIVTVGNAHAIEWVESVDRADWVRVGPAVATHEAFPGGLNAHAVERVSPATLLLRPWERGAGPTEACGSGACAAAFASVRLGSSPADTPIEVVMPGGVLSVSCGATSGMTQRGPATISFEGCWALR